MSSLSEVSAELEPTASCPVDELTPSSLPGICKVYLDLIASQKDPRNSNLSRACSSAQLSSASRSHGSSSSQQILANLVT